MKTNEKKIVDLTRDILDAFDNPHRKKIAGERFEDYLARGLVYAGITIADENNGPKIGLMLII